MLVTASAAAQPGEGVDGGGEEAGDDEAGDVHVDELVPQVVVAEERVKRADVADAAAFEHEAARVVHPGVYGDHHQGAHEAGDDDGDAAQEVRPGRQAIPAVDVDGDEDGLDEEREGLEREAEAEHLAEGGHEIRPQEAELEAQDCAGDDADCEQGEHHLRPALGDRPVERVAGSQPEALEQEHEGGEGDAEADDRDVDGERERLHLPRLEKVVLVDRSEGSGGE